MRGRRGSPLVWRRRSGKPVATRGIEVTLDAKLRSTRLLKGSKNLGLAEVLSGILHEAVEKHQATPYA
jgi:hypothetical protein